MGNTANKGYADPIGKHALWVGDHTGPTSYVVGGETIISGYLGLRSIDWMDSMGLSLSGNYYAEGQMKAIGTRQQALLRWFYSGIGSSGQGVASVVIAGAGSGQTNGVYVVTANTGTATIQVTVAGAAVTAVKILNPGGPYYTVPTFTVAAGGTPGTVTATLGNTSGIEVAPGTNLSAETVRLLVTGA